MKKGLSFVFITILIFFGMTVLFLLSTRVPVQVTKDTPLHPIIQTPDASAPPKPLDPPSSKDPWEVWIHEQADIMAKVAVKAHPNQWNYDEVYEEAVLQLTEMALGLKNQLDTPPPLDVNPTVTQEIGKKPKEKYDGPQTVEALIEKYGDFFGSSPVDEMYPPNEWLQRILDKGVTIKDKSDVMGYLVMRGTLFLAAKDPAWQENLANGFGYPTDSWEAFEDAYITHKIFLRQQYAAAREADPSINGAIVIRDHLLPTYFDKKVVYIERRTAGATTYGASLTKEQEFNLIFRGIEPEGIDVVYIDAGGSRLPEKPPPITQDEFIDASLDQWLEDTQNMDSDWVPPMLELPEVFEFSPETAKEYAPNATEPHAEGAAAATNAARAQMELARREIERFASLTDAEIEVELKKILTLMLPEHAGKQLETEISENFSPERFQEAMSLLNRHGSEKGFQRIQETNPALAEYFRQGQVPQQPAVQSVHERGDNK